jgi:hypothetical protein
MQIHEKAYKSNVSAVETNLQLLFDIPPDVDFKPLDSHKSNDGWTLQKRQFVYFSECFFLGFRAVNKFLTIRAFSIIFRTRLQASGNGLYAMQGKSYIHSASAIFAAIYALLALFLAFLS